MVNIQRIFIENVIGLVRQFQLLKLLKDINLEDMLKNLGVRMVIIGLQMIEKAFVFSLNHMKVYNPVYGKYKYFPPDEKMKTTVRMWPSYEELVEKYSK